MYGLISFNEIKPYLRYSRQINNDISNFKNPIIGYDSRLFYCINGYGTIKINSIEYAVKPNSLIFWRSGMECEYYPQRNNPMQFYAFNFDFCYNFSHVSTPIPPNEKSAFDYTKITDNTRFCDADLFNKPFILENVVVFKNSFEKIDNIFSDKKYAMSFVAADF